MKPIWGPDEESMQPSWTDSGRETGGEVGDRLMFFIYISQQNRGKTNWNHCKTVTEGEMERESARDHEPYRERERVQEGEGTGCLWGHLPNLCFQHFLPTLIFQLCSTLITSIHMWESVGMFVNVYASHSVCWFCMDPHVTATLVIATQTVWKHAHKLLFLYINHSILQRNNWELVNIPCNLSSWSEGKNWKDKILSRYTKCVTSSYHLWTSASPYHGTVDLCKQNKTNS